MATESQLKHERILDLCDDLDALREALEYVRDHTFMSPAGSGLSRVDFIGFTAGYDPQVVLDAIARVS